MKNIAKLKYYSDFECILILLLCINIPILTSYWLEILQCVLRGSCIIAIFIFFLKDKKKIQINFILLISWYIFIGMITLFRGGDVFYYANIISKPFLILLYLMYRSEYTRFHSILKMWRNFLILLCGVDLISILLFPNGIEIMSYYSQTWFLGYKTARLVYILPLITLETYIEIKGNNKLTYRVLLIYTLSLLSSILSKSTMGMAGIFIYIVLVLLFNGCCIKNKNTKLFYKMLNSKVIILTFTVMAIVLVTLPYNSLIQFIVQDIFHKSSTLSNRTDIWKNCLYAILENPFFGKGFLNLEQYIKLTDFRLGTSAHSFILSLLITGGIIGYMYYCFLIYRFLKRRKKIYTLAEIGLILGIVSFFFIGLTSSTLAFSIFSNLYFVILEIENLYANKNINESGGLKVC